MTDALTDHYTLRPSEKLSNEDIVEAAAAESTPTEPVYPSVAEMAANTDPLVGPGRYYKPKGEGEVLGMEPPEDEDPTIDSTEEFGQNKQLYGSQPGYHDQPDAIKQQAIKNEELIQAAAQVLSNFAHTPRGREVIRNIIRDRYAQPENPVPQYGDIWRHSKTNGVYEILDIAVIEATEEPAAVYRNIYDHSKKWIRPLSQFTELVDAGDPYNLVPRFVLEFRAGGLL